mmetsp:Transcript_94335/g.305252  ORF Transcript_94335/g.305252 Transcript_94335/m.305252 type:complete len:119 (-) Transcript_94335:230-586(-)
MMWTGRGEGLAQAKWCDLMSPTWCRRRSALILEVIAIVAVDNCDTRSCADHDDGHVGEHKDASYDDCDVCLACTYVWTDFMHVSVLGRRCMRVPLVQLPHMLDGAVLRRKSCKVDANR